MGCGNSKVVVVSRGETNPADLPEKPGDMLTTIERSKIKNMKIAVVGESGAGKTSICERYFTNSFDPRHHKSNQLRTYTAIEQVSNHPAVPFSETFLEIPCESSPLEKKKQLAGMDGAIVVVELRSRYDILHGGKWREELLDGIDEGELSVPMLLLGNKFDLVGEQYKPSEGEKKKACKNDISAFVDIFTRENYFTNSACVSAKDDETSLSVIRTFLQQKVRRHQMNKIFRDREATAAADAAGRK